ncbi:MAG: GTP cyclohydrolase II [Acidobacteriota bacterium]|nr:GTP cyclohydrolase II [Acidobacteriota bacterium]
MKTKPAMRKTVALPLVVRGRQVDAQIVTFSNLSDPKEHVALVVSGVDSPHHLPIVRIHSECLTGDVFGSARCDCGPQLEESLEILSWNGGVVLYLRQEGRGIGLYAKIDAYELQDCGLNTYDANVELGFSPDARDYRVAAEMLQALEINVIRLLTNNPDKRTQLEHCGIVVAEQLSTRTYLTSHNASYLATKVNRAGHALLLLPLPAAPPDGTKSA